MRRGLLYAGTEKGVYVSFDDGDHWQPLQANLPVTSVRDIDVHGDDLVIATHGRAFWILDDLTPLRQLDARPSAPGAPGSSRRRRRSACARPASPARPMPKDEPAAANPAAGAVIDYVLKAPPQPVIARDPRRPGRAGAALQQRGRGAEADARQARHRAGLGQPPSTLAATPGHHRFVWPLRYPAAPAMAGETPYDDGVWAPPGRYTVTLGPAA